MEIRVANDLKNDLAHDWDSVMNLVDMADINLSAIRAEEVITEKIAVEDFQDIDKDSIKGKLQRLSGTLEKALNDRLKTIPIIQAALNAFSEYEWYNKRLFNSVAQLEELAKRLESITRNIHGPFKEIISAWEAKEEILSGYNIFLTFVTHY